MIREMEFIYLPSEHEAEKASNSYLMSLVAIVAGLPMPLINVLATFFFYLANRKGTYFVRWHCTQALLTQMSLVFINGLAFYWAISIIFFGLPMSPFFVVYLLFAIGFNVLEFIITIYSAIQTRKGIHVEWWFYSSLTHTICKERV